MKNKKRSPIVPLVTVSALVLSLCSGILIMDRAQAQSKNDSAGAATKRPAQSRYIRDLTKLARQGKLDVVKGHGAAVRPVIQILSRSQQNNPVLIGEDGLASMAVVEGLAQRINEGHVPENLRQTHLYSLNLYSLLADAKTTADLEGRLKTVLSEVSSDKGNSILFIDQLYQFVGKHAAESVAQILTEATVAGKVRLIGAT